MCAVTRAGKLAPSRMPAMMPAMKPICQPCLMYGVLRVSICGRMRAVRDTHDSGGKGACQSHLDAEDRKRVDVLARRRDGGEDNRVS